MKTDWDKLRDKYQSGIDYDDFINLPYQEQQYVLARMEQDGKMSPGEIGELAVAADQHHVCVLIVVDFKRKTIVRREEL